MLDLGETGGVVLGDDQVEQLAGIGEPAAEAVEVGERRVEPGPLATEFLRALRVVPDARIAQFPVQLLEPLALAVVLKGTPSARQGAGRVLRAIGGRVRLP